MPNSQKQISVAIIGMGCMFPGATNLKEYWRLLFKGQDAIGEVPSTHWSTQDYYDPNPKAPDHTYSNRGGFLAPVIFDPTEFGIPPNTLEATDSTQLLSLLAAKAALRDAGYAEGRSFNREKTSVILGVTGSQELVIPLGARLGFPHWQRALREAGLSDKKSIEIIDNISRAYVPWHENSFPGLLGNVVAGRICNRLDLGGTNCVVDAACASSMSAVHLALLELASGRSDMVLTGGADTFNDIFMYMCFSKTGILSPTGDARPFSKNADGTVLGEGIGIVVLKRLDQAVRDDDKIYAVIRGIGTSSDGRSQSIYAPRAEGQSKALRIAYEAAATDPQTIELIEAHGTGTRVGDAVEFEALCQVFGPPPPDGRKCALGSVKSMIGHTKAAAGAAGLIKAALALHHKVLPPTLKAEPPDPKLNIDQSPFYLNTQAQPWLPKADTPRRAGVSSFGFGGSNFHVVLEEYRPEKNEIAWDGSIQIMAFSADSKSELMRQLQDVTTALSGDFSAHHLAAAAARSCNRFSYKERYRLLWVVDTQVVASGSFRTMFEQGLAAFEPDADVPECSGVHLYVGSNAPVGGLALLFPGQGSQYPGMGADLVCCFPEAMLILAEADRCFGSLPNISERLYLAAKDPTQQLANLTDTAVAQPAVGAVSLVMLKLLEYFGVEPDAVCGHSFGELTALHAAGWLDQKGFLEMAALRGRLMAKAAEDESLPKGGMLAVKTSPEEVARLLPQISKELVLANRNSPHQSVLSGSLAALSQIETLLGSKNIAAVRLPVSAAFHSPQMQGVLAPFRSALNPIETKPLKIPVIANSSARPYPADPHQAKDLLAEQLIRPVDFAGCIEALYQSGLRCFVETGPKNVLTGLVNAALAGREFETIALDRSARKGFGISDFAQALCRLAAMGYAVRLDRWESPPVEAPKAKMQISISGANYRTHRQQPPSPRTSAVTLLEKPLAPAPEAGTEQSITPRPDDVSGPLDRQIGDMDSMKKEGPKPKDSALIAHALAAVQQGLQSMQTIQVQTAEAHQKFLEAQTEAGRALQQMMAHTRRLAEISLSGASLDIPSIAPSPPQPVAEPQVQNLNPPMPPLSDIEHPAAKHPSPGAGDDGSSSRPSVDSTRSPMHTDAVGKGQANEASDDTAALEQLLREVVGELTGYPLEMIGLDMDIEADLGIDSIKRVEILSTLEERRPDLPSITPDVLGRIKTLQEVISLFQSNARLQNPTPQTSGHSSGEEAPAKITEPIRPPDSKNLAEVVLAVVSELTGYPEDMIGLDMDIEADLGIDSIKRVEILSCLEERLPDLPSVSPEIMGTLKTLRQLLETLGNDTPGTTVSVASAPASAPSRSLDGNDDRERVTESTMPLETPSRYRIHPLKKELNARPGLDLPQGRKFFITDDRTGLSEAIAEVLGEKGINTVLISPDILTFKEALPPAAGLLIVQNPEKALDTRNLKEIFGLTRHLGPDLCESAAQGGAVFGAVVRLDGAFGFAGCGVQNPLQGALAGLIKTAGIEWQEVTCRIVDVAPEWRDPKAIAHAVVAELFCADPDHPAEIGLNADERFVLDLQPAPYETGQVKPLSLQPSDLIVVSGGARGITAAAVRELAERFRPTFVLLGRTPEPTREPSWLEGLRDAAAMKKAILEHQFNGKVDAPRDLDRAYRGVLRNREIETNLAHIRKLGSEVIYRSVDIRNPIKVKAVLKEIRKTYGPVKALIHGAGVLQDRLIADKTAQQFETVFETKVAGFQALLESVRHDPLHSIVIFSSVAARFGNAGQADYAMANEALNKMAQQLAAERPDCRVAAINWGPWDGGMVTSALKRQFESKAIPLISIREGIQCLMREMALPNDGGVEVVIGGRLDPVSGPNGSSPRKDVGPLKAVAAADHDMALIFQREIDLARYPVLSSHVLDGKPVVPLALMAEWFAHAALHENPGLVLQGLDDMRVLLGIKLDEEQKQIRLLAGKALKNGSQYEVRLELRDGIQGGREVVHARARAILVDGLEPAPKYRFPEDFKPRPYRRTIEEIYEKILFHGKHLKGLKAVKHFSSEQMIADIVPAPAPGQWLREPLRNKWLIDPLVLDTAFQMATIWCYEEIGAVSLPTYCGSYRQYRSRFPSDGVTAILDIQATRTHKMKGDFTFLDTDRNVVATLDGYEAAVDESLYKAFKSEKTAAA